MHPNEEVLTRTLGDDEAITRLDHGKGDTNCKQELG